MSPLGPTSGGGATNFVPPAPRQTGDFTAIVRVAPRTRSDPRAKLV